MKFEPVFLEDASWESVTQTLLGRYNLCERSAFLYAKHRGGQGAHPMRRGSAQHRILELATRELEKRDVAEWGDEPHLPGEVVKDIVDEVLADPAFPVQLEEHDYMREASYRWASEVTFDPRALVACETLFEWEVAGFRVRARIDLALLVERGAAVRVWDYKSSRSMPSREDISRKRRDGSFAAKSFQLVLYALILVFGKPVREAQCPRCGGTGFARDNFTATVEAAAAVNERFGGPPVPCGRCRRGRVEVVEPFGLADTAQRFDLALVFPGIEDRETGGMAKREASLTRAEVYAYRASLEALLLRLRHSIDAGDWPAVDGAHCKECAAPGECPIPKELRPFTGEVNTREEAVEAAERLSRERANHASRWAELRILCKARGWTIRFGRDQILDFGYEEVDEIRDKEGFLEAVERAAAYGEPLDRSRFLKRKVRTPFRQRTLSEAELDEEAGGDGS